MPEFRVAVCGDIDKVLYGVRVANPNPMIAARSWDESLGPTKREDRIVLFATDMKAAQAFCFAMALQYFSDAPVSDGRDWRTASDFPALPPASEGAIICVLSRMMRVYIQAPDGSYKQEHPNQIFAADPVYGQAYSKILPPVRI